MAEPACIPFADRSVPGKLAIAAGSDYIVIAIYNWLAQEMMVLTRLGMAALLDNREFNQDSFRPRLKSQVLIIFLT